MYMYSKRGLRACTRTHDDRFVAKFRRPTPLRVHVMPGLGRPSARQKNSAVSPSAVSTDCGPMLFASTLHTELPHWINDEPLFPLHCQAKVRYRQADQACTLDKQSDGTLIVRFDQPQRAITPGQYAVFYTGDQCLGGAVIAHALDSS